MATNEDVLSEALARFDQVSNQERDQREFAIKDMLFAHAEDGQWDESARTARKGRPRYTFNRIAGAIDQVQGDQRQTSTRIKVRPSTGGDKDVAKIFTGLIAEIEDRSKASKAYDGAYVEQVTGGWGGWRVKTGFVDDETFDQDISIEPIRSAASSLYFDPSSKRDNKSDAMWAFLIESVTLEEFKQKFPDAVESDFTSDRYSTGTCAGWFQDNSVRIAEYWRVTMDSVTLAQLSNGYVINMDEEKSVLDEMAALGIKVLRTRKAKIRKLESFILNGAEILEGPTPWAGKFIPLVPLFGRQIHIENAVYTSGMVRKAIDPQQVYNYVSSAAVEATALAPKDPYWITATQAEGYTDKLESFNSQNSPFLLYNADPLAPGPPQRTGAPAVQAALIQQTDQAAANIYATTNVQPPSLGLNPEMQSGKAIIAQQKMGDRATFIFSDNLNDAIAYTGEILVDLLPRVYDTHRLARTLEADGTSEEVGINVPGTDEFNMPIIDQQTGKRIIVNDLSLGRYAVTLDTGPTYSTQREQSSQQLIDLTANSPIFAALAADLVAKNLDILEGDELTKRVRKQMISQGIVEPTEDEVKELGLNQEQPPDPAQVALLDNLKMQTALAAATIENKNADTDKKDAETLQTKIDAMSETITGYQKLVASYADQQSAGIPLGADEHEVRKDHIGLIGLTQEEVVQDQ